MLFNNVIPVKQNGKWGMYDKKGNLILPIVYDGIGCVASDRTLNNILTIPNVKGIYFFFKKFIKYKKKKQRHYME